MPRPTFPPPPQTVWTLADPLGAATFVHAVGSWSIALADWLREEPAELTPELRAMLLGLLEERPDLPSGLRPFPRSAVADPSPESATALLQWRRRGVDYLADVWDVMGEPRFGHVECAAATAALSPVDAAERCAGCLLQVALAERPGHWSVCPARALREASDPASPFAPGQLAPPPPPPPGFNPEGREPE